MFLNKIINNHRISEVTYNIWAKKSLKRFLNKTKYYEESSLKISLIVACYNTPINLFDEMLNSVLRQSYSNWELCIADGSDNTALQDFVESRYKNNDKIKYRYLNHNGGISENMNAALEMTTGDYIGFFDHDDLLTSNALEEMIKCINEHEDAQMLYSDEDKTNESADRYFFPHFKPDFNLDLLLTSNYICHFLVVKRELLENIGAFRKEYDGAQDYDFVLRCASFLKGEGIYHIPRILYHWRVHEGSTAGKAESKSWAFDAGKAALEDYLKYNHIIGHVENSFAPGYYRVKYDLKEKPLVSIILTNVKDKKTLNKCIQSIKGHTNYDNYELIVVGNNDIVKDSYFEDVTYVKTEAKNNDSISKNIGAKNANGKYLLFLNASLLITDENWLTEMLSVCQRDNTGIVGSQLLTNKQKIVHAGIVIRHDGQLLYPYQGKKRETLGYNGYVQSIRDYSAVSSDCLMINKRLYEQVEGFNESIDDLVSGIDLCLKVKSLNKLVIYDPFVCLQFDANHINKGISKKDKVYLIDKWRSYVDNDPSYNPHFSDRYAFTLDVNSEL